jgi:hypothetical protein
MRFLIATLSGLLLSGEVGTVPSAPSVAGLHLSVTREVAVGALGKPSRVIEHPPDDELGMGRIVELQYRGLAVWVCYPPSIGRSNVFRIEVNSSKWPVSNGARVGLTRSRVIALLGEPTSTSQGTHTGQEVLRYSAYRFDGWLDLTVERGVVTRIVLAQDWA